MSATYGVRVLRLAPPEVELEIVPAQPDCCPFYPTRLFALALLADAPARGGSQPVRDRLPRRVWEDVGSSRYDASTLVPLVEIVSTVGLPWDYGQPAPVARYRVRVSEPGLLAHLHEGQRYESVAYDDGAEGN